MARLPVEKRKAVAKAESEDPYKSIPDGKYRVKLAKVEIGLKTKAGEPKWVWHFKTVEPKEHAGAVLKEHVAIKDTTMWKFGQIYKALGSTPETDSDELIGTTTMVEVANNPSPGKDGGAPRSFPNIVKYLSDDEEPFIFLKDDTGAQLTSTEDVDDDVPAKKKPARRPVAKADVKPIKPVTRVDEEPPF